MAVSEAVLMPRSSVSSLLPLVEVWEFEPEFGDAESHLSGLNSSRSLSRFEVGCAGLVGSEGGPVGQNLGLRWTPTLLRLMRVLGGMRQSLPSRTMGCGLPGGVDLGILTTGGTKRSSSFRTAPAMPLKSLGRSRS